jgi:hypothetical protein
MRSRHRRKSRPKIITGVLAIAAIAALPVALSAGASPQLGDAQAAVTQSWRPLPPGPAPASNPLEGFVPYAGSYATFPYSMEFFYMPLNAVMTGPNTFDWSALDSQLKAIAARGHQAVLRFYLDYPGRPSGVPQFLLNEGVACHPYSAYGNSSSCSPDYGDPRLDQALDQFIAAFGARYDGSPRIGFIELGLLGFWGEWHTYPYNGVAEPQNWFASPAEQDRVLADYTAAFSKTKLLVRYPTPCTSCSSVGTSNASMPVGYHDDSFALETLPSSTGFHFLDLLSQAGATGKWRQQPIGGELRPELQACIFDQPPDCPNIEAGGDNTVYGAKDFADSVAQTHASWLINQTAFDPGYTGADHSRAFAGSQSLGYQFSVTRAAIDQPNNTTLQVGASIANNGVAPFYYDWPLQVAAVAGDGRIAESWNVALRISSVQPGATGQFVSDLPIGGQMPQGMYSIVVRVVNPLPGGVPLQFANAGQGKTLSGWMTLGTVRTTSGAASPTASPSASRAAAPSLSPPRTASASPSPSPSPTRTAVTGPPVSLEAVAPGNTLAGGAVVQDCSACIGGQKVGYIGNGGTLAFRHIRERAAGRYTLTIAYVDGGSPRSATIITDGVAVTKEFNGTNNDNWDNVQTITFPVHLRAGTNTIEFTNPSAWAPDINRVLISRNPG